MAALIVGADVGGTSTRVGIASLDGQVLTLASGPAGNPNSVGLQTSATRIRAAVDRCLTAPAVERAEIGAVVIGLAGGSRGDDAFLTSLLPPGLEVSPRLVSDLAVAFNSATAERQGYVLVAGTGAVAGRIVDGELRERRDGWGWLLGDEGSGFWLGREAVRATLRQLQVDPTRLGSLASAVIEAAGTGPDPVAIITRCYTEPPIWLAGFGALVSRHLDDPIAAEIAERAAGYLVATLLDLGLEPTLPVVLAGSVATRPGPVRSALIGRLQESLSRPPLAAEAGVVGALWLAARQLGVDEPAVHAELTATTRRTTVEVV
ncbi:MAG: BadF/BadG/BcrA/BcrD ATPase family protein [Microlunatus sp.]